MSCVMLDLNVLMMHCRVTLSATSAQTRTQCRAKNQHRQWSMLARQVNCLQPVGQDQCCFCTNSVPLQQLNVADQSLLRISSIERGQRKSTPAVNDSNPAVSLYLRQSTCMGLFMLRVMYLEYLGTCAYVKSQLWSRRTLCCHYILHVDRSLGWHLSLV